MLRGEPSTSIGVPFKVYTGGHCCLSWLVFAFFSILSLGFVAWLGGCRFLSSIDEVRIECSTTGFLWEDGRSNVELVMIAIDTENLPRLAGRVKMWCKRDERLCIGGTSLVDSRSLVGLRMGSDSSDISMVWVEGGNAWICTNTKFGTNIYNIYGSVLFTL